MSKAVLISIRPEWAEKIASGEKTIEVRKTRPNLPTPFKVYLYVTAGSLSYKCPNGMIAHCNGGREVIGEFVCDRIVDAFWDNVPDAITREVTGSNLEVLDGSCLSDDEIYAYDGTWEYGYVYGWHISDLRIYDKPRQLVDFSRPCSRANCDERFWVDTCKKCATDRRIKRPPQSWMYVEEM